MGLVKVLNYKQKPIAVMKWLFSCEGDWILDGLSGAGMYIDEINVCI